MSFIFFLVPRRAQFYLLRMSAQEIIAELAKLKPEELRLVKEKLNRLNAESPMPQTGWGRALSEMAGKADDLPADLSLQHDHYLYRTPKRGRAA